ncbi:MAG: ATP-dependent Clp protease proteolytic subunit [Lachnospiraceae bacterium]|nr:ATP-dependent Clp protease proteolytic subunit [Lachnospiraceae bacterium]
MNTYPIAPHVIRDSSEGWQLLSIEDEMFNTHRSIEVAGEITRESVYSLILQLRYLQQADPEKEITIYINSPGGSVIDGLALYDTMALSSNIRTVCVGMAASMGALLFAAGNRREMLPHAEIMIHNPAVKCLSGSALQIEEESRRLMQMRKTTAEILAKHTGHTIEEVYEKTKQDTYFSAEEAVKWGLADRIIREI